MKTIRMGVGHRSGMLTVVEVGVPMSMCKCDCGGKKLVRNYNLKNNIVKSCGCLLHKGKWRHRIKKHKSTYNSYRNMLDRINNHKYQNYSRYGGRGIKVCDRWQESFDNFFEDMGKKPSKKYTLDRINTNGDYTPENCRWATREQQARNSTICKLTEPDVKTIKILRANGLKYIEIMGVIDISYAQLSAIMKGRYWADVT
jgi:hypothetical protein